MGHRAEYVSMETTPVNCSITSADWSGATSRLAPETQAKLQRVRNELLWLEHTGNPQYAIMAIQALIRINELERHNWSPETHHALENRETDE
jgi:hypothetical protein